MLSLPSGVGVRLADQEALDFGFVQRPSVGAPGTRIDRPGERIKARFVLPALSAEVARVVVSRLMRARGEGLRIDWPLMVDQGGVGSPVVVAAGSGGTALAIASATPGATIGEGYWLNVVDSGGVHYLHNCADDTVIDGGGSATLSVWPPLRADLVNGQAVIVTAPRIEGLVTEHSPFPRPHNKIVNVDFTLEEME